MIAVNYTANALFSCLSPNISHYHFNKSVRIIKQNILKKGKSPKKITSNSVGLEANISRNNFFATFFFIWEH